MRITFICLLLAFLFSCSGPEDSGPAHFIKGSSLSANTPNSLRAIDHNQLVLEMSIDGEISRYNGSVFPGETWSIELALQNDTTHTIDLKWFALEHLLLHEYGEFYADSMNPEIELDLEFADEGTGNFDDDCDGISNLEELTLGTDAGPEDCTADVTMEGANTNSVYLVRNFLSFVDSGYRGEVTSLEQSINVREADLTRNMWFYSKMINDEPFDTATEMSMTLFYKDDLQKHVYFEIDKDTIGAVPALGSTCGALEPTGHYCQLPFNWETGRWYGLRLDLVDLNIWQASVFDHLTGEPTVIGKIEVIPELKWDKPRIGLSYNNAMAETIADCNASLPRIAMQARSAIANDVVIVKKSTITVSRCVDGGTGWRAGTKTQDDINTYTLSIGDGF